MCNRNHTTKLPTFSTSDTTFDLCRLLPLVIDTDQTADGTSKADEAVIELGPSESGGRYREIAEIGEEL